MTNVELKSESIQTRIRRIWSAFSSLIVLGTLFVGVVILKPAMPDRILILTGPQDSAYHGLGVRMAKELRSRGLDAEVVVTRGAVDNLRRLGDEKHSVALAPSVINWRGDVKDAKLLVTLGSVANEPLWLFYRSDLDIGRLTDLAGKTVVTEGTHTTGFQIASTLVKEAGLWGEIKLTPIADQAGRRSFQGFAAGTVDAIFLSGKANSAIVRAMLDSDAVSLLSFERGEAYAMRVSGATVVVAPEGVFDLARNVPDRDTQLVAGTTCLVSHEDIHPALVPLLLSTVESMSLDSTSFISSDQFPSSDHTTLPLSPAAKRFYRQGEVGLSKHLPYQAVRFLNHFGFYILPLLTVIVIMLKTVPTGMRIWGGFRLRRWFKQLEAVEKGCASGADLQLLLSDLDAIDRSTATAFVPQSVVHDYVDFRQFLHDMRERVQDRDSSS